MTDSTLVFPPGFRIDDGDGNLAPGAVLRFYVAATSVPLTVYSDAALTTALGTSVTCDSTGYPSNSGSRVLIYTGSAAYKVRAEDADGVMLWEHPNVTGAVDTSAFLTTPSADVTYIVTNVTTSGTWVAADIERALFLCNPSGGSFSRVLPAASTSDGKQVILKHVGSSGVVSIQSTGSLFRTDSLDTGRDAILLVNQGDSAALTSDGVYWNATFSGDIHGAARRFVVEDRITAPPVTPTSGAAYLINGSPTGAFTSTTPPCADGDIVVADGIGGWIIYRPSSASTAWEVYDKTSAKLYRHIGTSWSDLAASDTAAGIIELATAAEVLTGTDAERAVTPATLRRHPGVVKAAASFSGGTGSINWSHNITSVTRTAAGTYDIVIADDMASAEYVVGGGANTGGASFYGGHNVSNQLAGSFTLLTVAVASGGGTTIGDFTRCYVWVMGDLA